MGFINLDNGKGMILKFLPVLLALFCLSACNNTENTSEKANTEAVSEIQETDIKNSVNEEDKEIDSIEEAEEAIVDTTINHDREYPSIPTDTEIEIGGFQQSDFDISYSEGTYKIGDDMPAGTYVGFGSQQWTGGASLYADAALTEELNSGNNWTNHFLFVTTSEGQFLKVNDLFLVPFDELLSKGLEHYGIFTVGKTLPVGQYKLEPLSSESKGFFKQYRDYTEESGEAYEIFPSAIYRTFMEGEIVVLQNVRATAPSKNADINTETSDGTFEKKYMPAMYRVGIDIEPGIYVAYGPQKWTSTIEISNGTSLADSGSSYNLNCIAIFLLDSGQYVDVHEDAYLVPYSVIKEMDPRTTGIYYVGKDVKAGEYKILPSNDENSHYWAIYSSLSISNMIKDSYFDNQEYVSLEDNTYFVMMNATFEDENAVIAPTTNEESTESSETKKNSDVSSRQTDRNSSQVINNAVPEIQEKSESDSNVDAATPDEIGLTKQVKSVDTEDAFFEVSFKNDGGINDAGIISIDFVRKYSFPDDMGTTFKQAYYVKQVRENDLYSVITQSKELSTTIKKMAVHDYGFDENIEVILRCILADSDGDESYNINDTLYTVYSDRDYFREVNGQDFELTETGVNDFINWWKQW